MNYLSVCSGIEAATVAWHDLGWRPSGFSEIETFPSAVLHHHYPEVNNFGDMTKYKEWDLDPNRVDLLVGGTPCQSFSVAGLRKGMDDPRGNLALVYCGMLDRFRPEWFVWENVPGVLSSNGGRDFGSFLGAVAELGYGFAYRVLDAQYFGVAQRRRRVFVVGHLGGWQRPAAVLLERQSMRRDTAPSRAERKDVTGPITAGINKGCRGTEGVESNWAIPVSYGIPGNWIGRKPENGVAQPMPINTMVALRHNALGRGTGFGIGDEGDPAYTITKGHSHAVAQPVAYGVGESPDTAHCLRSGASRADKHESTTYIAQQMAVRRLTPVECERLQGFPDNYTNIPWRKSSESPDGPRYKALGNSMAVPVMRWIGQRIQQVREIK